MKQKTASLLIPLVITGIFLLSPLAAQDLDKSAYHLFLDFDFAITLEVVEDGKEVVPILNIIAFSGGTWELSPPDMKILNDKGRYAVDPRFSFDTGDSSKPYVSTYLKIEGGDFIGVDLIGDFKDYKEPKLIRMRIGDEWFHLEPVEKDAFESMLSGLDNLDLRDPDLVTAFDKLNLPLIGTRDLINE